MFYFEWMPHDRELPERRRGVDGYLASFWSVSVQMNADTKLFSVAVVGMDSAYPTMRCLG